MKESEANCQAWHHSHSGNTLLHSNLDWSNCATRSSAASRTAGLMACHYLTVVLSTTPRRSLAIVSLENATKCDRIYLSSSFSVDGLRDWTLRTSCGFPWRASMRSSLPIYYDVVFNPMGSKHEPRWKLSLMVGIKTRRVRIRVQSKPV